MDALVGAIATILVALIGLVSVRLETTRRTVNATRVTAAATQQTIENAGETIKNIGYANTADHESTTLLLKSLVRDVGGLRADVRDLTKRFNDHVDEVHP